MNGMDPKTTGQAECRLRVSSFSTSSIPGVPTFIWHLLGGRMPYPLSIYGRNPDYYRTRTRTRLVVRHKRLTKLFAKLMGIRCRRAYGFGLAATATGLVRRSRLA